MIIKYTLRGRNLLANREIMLIQQILTFWLILENAHIVVYARSRKMTELTKCLQKLV